jgi:iron(III) transport system substrate-binding protein
MQRLISALLAMIVLAACGAPTTGTPSPSGGAGTNPSAAASPSPADSPEADASPSSETTTPTDAETETPEETATADSAGGVPGTGTDATAATGEGAITVYSGRSEELVGPIIERFREETGIQINVRYGDTAELASTILDEGENSPADVFFAQDAGALGALQEEGRLTAMPNTVLDQVDERFRSTEDNWVGVSGRARVVAYNTQALTETDLPDTILGFTDPQWKGRIGWAPTNASFQAFVTALRLLEGEEAARQWLEGIQANEPKVYQNNSAIVEALGRGEIDVGFVNHYYLFRFLEEQGEDFPVRNYYLTNGDPGALVNVAGAGILNTSQNQEGAQQFVEFLLSEDAQQYFADETYEYPLANSIAANPALPSLDQIQTPQLELGQLSDLQGTLELLQDVGVLQ